MALKVTLPKMSKAEKIKKFDPNGVGIKNNHFIGLPFDEQEAEVVLLPVPWDVTVSYADGTAEGPANILEASAQLDLFDPFVKDAWKMGLYMRPSSDYWLEKSKQLRPIAQDYIDFLEEGGKVEASAERSQQLKMLNDECLALKQWVKNECLKLLEHRKIVGLVGGEHSVPLGLLEALAEKYEQFGILQIDAHLDLRKAYEGFTYSHASIFYNALQIEAVNKIVHVGIRDYCEAEVDFATAYGERVHIFYDHQIAASIYNGVSFGAICRKIVEQLPDKVYISFDIDGLIPSLCPNTGTPVPGGLEFQQAMFLLQLVVESGRTIIGFDLCEVAGFSHEWDGNVGARVLYRLANLTGKSQGKI